MADRGGGWWPEGRDEDPPSGDDAEDRTEPEEPKRRPPRGLASRDRPKVASRYSLFVGLAFAAIALVAILNAVRTDEGGIAGADREGDRGVPLPEFALPQLPGPLAGQDANIAQDDCESSRNPCPEDQQRLPACEIDREGAIRICDLFDRPLAISFWFTRGGDCLPTQDAFDQVAGRREGELSFLSVNVLDDSDSVVEIARANGWRVPVGHDADGAVSNLTGVGVCPTIVLAYPGGIIHSVEIKPGNFDAAEIEELVDELLAATAERGPASRKEQRPSGGGAG